MLVILPHSGQRKCIDSSYQNVQLLAGKYFSVEQENVFWYDNTCLMYGKANNNFNIIILFDRIIQHHSCTNFIMYKYIEF